MAATTAATTASGESGGNAATVAIAVKEATVEIAETGVNAEDPAVAAARRNRSRPWPFQPDTPLEDRHETFQPPDFDRRRLDPRR
jgi:hypothetical protein